MGTENLSLSDIAAACGNGCNGNQFNNPIWLIWAMLFGNGGGFLGNRCNAQGLQDAEIMSQLNAIRSQMQDNQNTSAVLNSVAGNHEALHGINHDMSLGFAGTNAAINAASMANILGQKDAQAQLAQCCCENKMQTMQMGYEGQLRDQQNTASITSRIDQLANGITQGFSAVAYAQQQQTNELTNQFAAGQQRIVDTLNAHWQSELAQKYDDAKLELSQLRQNATLIAALKTT